MHAKRRETRQNMWFEFSYNDDKDYRHKIVTIHIGNSIIVLGKLISYGRSRFEFIWRHSCPDNHNSQSY